MGHQGSTGESSGESSFLNVWVVTVLLGFQSYPSHSWWNSEKHKTYVLLTFCTLSELRHTLAVSSPSQGRRNQGLLDMETLPCSLLGKRNASRILLLGMALTTALGKYKKEERLNIPSAAANPSHKKVELEATFRGYPVFFPPPFIPSTFICSCACCDSSQFTQTGRITLRVKEADAWGNWAFLIDTSQHSVCSSRHDWALLLHSSEDLF